MHYQLICSLLVLLLMIAGAASAANREIMGRVPSGESTAMKERMVQRIVTGEDDGSQIEVAVGDIIRVDLRFHGGSGFSWYPDLPDANSLQLIDSRSVDLSEAGMVGGPSLGMWYFKVLKPGNSTLLMRHYRVWEGKSKANRNFSINLHVIENRGGR